MKIVTSTYLSSIGLDPTDELTLHKFNFVKLYIDEEPIYNIYTEQAVLNAPTCIDGVWRRKWSVRYLSPEQQSMHIDDLKISIVACIDEQTSQSILDGFSYVVDIEDVPTELWFSYHHDDQRNFTDTATVATLYILSGSTSTDNESLPTSVIWTGYTDSTRQTVVNITLDATSFLALYLHALVHKLEQLAIGKHNKHYITNTCTHMFQLLEYIEEYELPISLTNYKE